MDRPFLRALARFQSREDGVLSPRLLEEVCELEAHARDDLPAFWEAILPYAGTRRLYNAASQQAAMVRIADLIATPDVRHVVDAGCGDGFDVAFLADWFRNRRFSAYDPARNANEKVQGRIKRYRLDGRVKMFTADHSNAWEQIGTASADIVYSHCSLIGDAPHPPIGEDLRSSAWRTFVADDPGLRPWRDGYSGFRKMLRPGGRLCMIQILCCQFTLNMHTEVAQRCGLRFLRAEPLETLTEEGGVVALFFAAV